jgi:membrane-associated protease RseP (regulator of RpoE activity)
LDQAAEIALIKSSVGRFFTVYDVKVSYESVEVMISANPATLESDFEELRKDMYSKGYIPILDYTKGEYSINIVRKPPAVKRRIWINLILLFATFGTTIYAGMILYANYVGSTELYTLDIFVWGVILFAFPLMLILGVHELSHFYMSKKHGLDASLPYFIPAPPIIGTFGAFISMRDPMPNKKALIDIGVAGPLGGLLVSIPIALIGLLLNQGAMPHPALPPAGQMSVNIPLLFEAFLWLIPLPADVALHPTAFAAWVGIFVTAINLLPGGQLDGGHIARGLLGKNAKFLSIVTVMVLFFLGVFFYTGWLIFAFLIGVLGLAHPAPLNDVTKLDAKRIFVGVLALLILIASFVFVPIYIVPDVATFDLGFQGSNETAVAAGGLAFFYLTVNNTGTMNITVDMDVRGLPAGWGALIYVAGNSTANSSDSLSLSVPYDSTATVAIEVLVPGGQLPGDTSLTLSASTQGMGASATTQVTKSFMVQVV